MQASVHFGIKRGRGDDWFDTLLDADTEIFIDPFLIFAERKGPWRTSHDRIIEHFNRAFLLIAEGNMNTRSLAYRKAVDILVFREPRELCLGYTAKGTAGSGSGRGFARRMAKAVATAIARGLENPRHFEELGILESGIGPDRIADITATILKPQLIEYTRKIATKHSIRMHRHTLFAGDFDARRQRWTPSAVEVPTNPYTEGPLLFVPQRFLRPLPVLNAYEWWDWYESERLRTDLNYEVMGNVDKATIIRAAQRNPSAVRRWTTERERGSAEPYDFDADPRGIYKWDPITSKFVRHHPIRITPPSTQQEFIDVLEQIIREYKHFIEQQGGWDLLWKNHKTGDEKPESAAQLLFRGIAQSHCRANDISLDREVNLGRGPVDFKFSNGYRHRAHLEVKKLHNGHFWNGLHAQLPSYMKSDRLKDGWLMAVHLRDNKSSVLRARQLPQEVADAAKKSRLNIRFSLVDARPKASASKLRQT